MMEPALIGLRILVYAGSIAAAGGVLFALSFPGAADQVRSDIGRQIRFGCLLLLAVEPLRYFAFQLAVAQGDWSQAFAPDMRWMAFAMPIGRAAGVRIIAAIVLLCVRSRAVAISAVAALAMISSFLLEGHTASEETRSLATTAALALHVAAVHWWLGALYPLFAIDRQNGAPALASAAEAFGGRAVWIVPALIGAGALLLGILVGWSPRLESPYQQRFAIKLGLVAMLLAFAAVNKLFLTPLVKRDPASGSLKLKRSIGIEIVVALIILAATAWALSTGPDE